MEFAQEPIFQWLAQYAYEPSMVYLCVVFLMTASSFGFPLPEEVTIISLGVLSYMGSHPQAFPPPYPGAPVVNGYDAAIVASLAIFCSDLLVFSIGRFFGDRLRKKPSLERFFQSSNVIKINSFVARYGNYAAFIFRFTPGIRFPAHLFLGMSRFSPLAFILIDGFAVLISVPTQILLIFYFGEPILTTLHDLKFYLAGALLVFIAYLLVRRIQKQRLAKLNPQL